MQLPVAAIMVGESGKRPAGVGRARFAGGSRGGKHGRRGRGHGGFGRKGEGT